MKDSHDVDFGPDGTPTPERGVATVGGFSLPRGCGVAQVLMRGHAVANHLLRRNVPTLPLVSLTCSCITGSSSSPEDL